MLGAQNEHGIKCQEVHIRRRLGSDGWFIYQTITHETAQKPEANNVFLFLDIFKKVVNLSKTVILFFNILIKHW